jgi:hypothetical protein
MLARMSSHASAPPSRPARTPFDVVKLDVVAALGFAGLVLVVLVLDGPPGSRWLAVHLFTLGVLTPLIVAFSHHQTTTLLRAAARPRTGTRAAVVGGAVLVAAGMVDPGTAVSPPLIATGATLTTGGVAVAWWRLRTHRRAAADDARFAWLVATYERAHLLFVVGAVFGALLGARLVPGAAHVAVRHGHLHAMLVGFAAVTLLGTVALYGPMLLRAQLEPGAEAAARRATAVITGAVTVAVGGLLARAAPGPWGEAARWLAGVALLTAAAGAAAVLLPLLRTVRRKGRRAPLAGVLLTCAIGWLTLALAANALVVGLGWWRLLEPVGGVALVGAFAQAIAATLLHVVTMWLPRRRRLRVWQRVDALPVWVAAVPQVLVAWLAVGWFA